MTGSLCQPRDAPAGTRPRDAPLALNAAVEACIERISAVAEGASAATEQVSASAQQSTAGTHLLATSAEQLAERARALDTLVGGFTLQAA